MNEDFLHFIWKFKLYDKNNLQTTDNEPIEIVSTGLPNKSSGPDFLNAQIKIGDTLWAGNVEIHIKSSDWTQHKHHADKVYNNVILHVVQYDNGETVCQKGDKIPTLVLAYDKQLELRYCQLLESTLIIPCQPVIKEIEPFHIRHFLSRVLIERLQEKLDDIHTILDDSKNDWREVFYRQLFRSFGFGANSLPFQMLAKCTPLRLITKHSNNAFLIEALLFGQAGFLEDEPDDDYQAKLKAEYIFQKSAYELAPLDKSLWRFGSLRPSNFPTVRIAQLAYLMTHFTDLADCIINNKNIANLAQLLSINKVSEYWETHYNFGKESNKRSKSLGKSSIEKIIINTIVPFLFAYGQAKNNEELQNNALLLLDTLSPESNSVIDTWNTIGLKADNAFYTQALLQLKNAYCDKRRCLSCAIGKMVIEKG